MHTISCEACQGDGKVEYTNGTPLRNCKICGGTGTLTITDTEYERLQKQEK